MKIGPLLISTFLFGCIFSVEGQQYTAMHGSNFSGSIGVQNNPSSIVSSPYGWDLTIFGFQFRTISNSVRGKNFPFYIFSPHYTSAKGNYARYADVQTDLKLFNGRFSLNRKNTVAFGMNIRSFVNAATSRINFTDSVKGARTFLYHNQQNRPISLNMTSSGWLEFFATYGFTALDNEVSRLNVGITFKLMRSMYGAYAQLDNLNIERTVSDGQVIDRISNGSASYGLSSTLGSVESFSPRAMFQRAQTSPGIDIGAEYIVKTQAVTSVFDEDDYYDYEWKIGLALIDLGYHKFSHGAESRSLSNLKEDITAEVIYDKFHSVESLSAFNDSLESIASATRVLRGNFNISSPARAVVNVDRFLWGNLYVNGDLSVNLNSAGDGKSRVKDSRFITLTPRWETKKFGIYAPVQFTRHGNVWIGGALRAGPLLIGTHHILNAVFNNKKLSGGAYLALTFRPGDFMKKRTDRRLNCPP